MQHSDQSFPHFLDSVKHALPYLQSFSVQLSQSTQCSFGPHTGIEGTVGAAVTPGTAGAAGSTVGSRR